MMRSIGLLSRVVRVQKCFSARALAEGEGIHMASSGQSSVARVLGKERGVSRFISARRTRVHRCAMDRLTKILKCNRFMCGVAIHQPLVLPRAPPRLVPSRPRRRPALLAKVPWWRQRVPMRWLKAPLQGRLLPRLAPHQNRQVAQLQRSLLPRLASWTPRRRQRYAFVPPAKTWWRSRSIVSGNPSLS